MSNRNPRWKAEGLIARKSWHLAQVETVEGEVLA